jgi:predicted phosphodiesterase
MSPRRKKRRIVVLSDIHLGDRRSTLQKPEVVKALIKELNRGKKIDELILLGDILDLAFSSFRDVIDQARTFFHRISTLNVGKYIYVPGNHDYHIWLLHIEKRDVIEPIQNEGLPKLPDYMGQFLNKESFFSEVLPEDLEEKLQIRYPNYEFMINGMRYLFHHGHQIYGPGVLLMSPREAINEGKGLKDLVIANSPILEFIYYHLERDQEMREKLEEAWRKYGSPGALLVVLNEVLDARVPKFMKLLIHVIRTAWLRLTLLRIKKDRGTEIDDIENEIRDYLELCDWQAPNPLRFIFGHSHVPGRKEIDGNLTVVNSGSWLKEDSKHNTYVLIEDNVVTLRKLGEKDPLFTTRV